MQWKRLAAHFDPMIQPGATFATILASAVDVFSFHGLSSYYWPALTLRSSFLPVSMRSLAAKSPKNCTTEQHAKFMPTPPAGE
jgi:hypothetical protein